MTCVMCGLPIDEQSEYRIHLVLDHAFAEHVQKHQRRLTRPPKLTLIPAPMFWALMLLLVYWACVFSLLGDSGAAMAGWWLGIAVYLVFLPFAYAPSATDAASDRAVTVARQEQTAPERTAAGADHRHLGAARDLALVAAFPQLDARFVQESVAVQASGRQLTAVRVQGDVPVEGDPFAPVDEWTTFAVTAEAQRFEPRQRDEAEPVVQLGDVDISRLQIGAGPHHRRGVAQRHRGQVLPLVPGRASVDRRSDGLECGPADDGDRWCCRLETR